MSKPNANDKKEGFSSSLGFLLSAVAAAVGLSNIWRFSAETAQYGGFIYVFFYLVCVVVIGYPVVLAELSFGRTKQQGLYESYQDHGKWKRLGFFASIVCFLIFCFYNVVAGWVVGYVGKTLGGNLIDKNQAGNYAFFTDAFKELKGNMFTNFICTFIMLIGAVFINQAGVSGGIEKCAKILMPIFLVMMIGLIGYSCTLDGAGKGIAFYLKPKWDHVSFKAFVCALSQSFMSLGIGMGALVTYGAYVSKQDNLRKSSLVIVVGDTLVALCAGFFLFAFLGHMNFPFKVFTHPEVAKENPAFATNPTGLAFIILPSIFSKIGGVMGMLLALSFFLLLIFAAITSSISLLEVPTTYLVSAYKMNRKHAIWLLAGCSYVISVLCILSDSNCESLWTIMPNPAETNFMEFFQNFVLMILTPLATFCFILFIGRKFKLENVFKESAGEKAPNKFFVQYITITVKYIAPVLVGFSFLYSSLDMIFGVDEMYKAVFG